MVSRQSFSSILILSPSPSTRSTHIRSIDLPSKTMDHGWCHPCVVVDDVFEDTIPLGFVFPYMGTLSFRWRNTFTIYSRQSGSYQITALFGFAVILEGCELVSEGCVVDCAWGLVEDHQLLLCYRSLQPHPISHFDTLLHTYSTRIVRHNYK